MPRPLHALLEEEEDEEGENGNHYKQSHQPFKSYKTKRNSVDFDSLRNNNNGNESNKLFRPLSLNFNNNNKPFNFTSKVSQPPNFQRHSISSSDSTNNNNASQSSISTSMTSQSAMSPINTNGNNNINNQSCDNFTFGSSADFDFGGMPPLPSLNQSPNSNESESPSLSGGKFNESPNGKFNDSPVKFNGSPNSKLSNGRRTGSIQYRRSEDDENFSHSRRSSSGGSAHSFKVPRPLNLVNKQRTTSNSISSNSTTETNCHTCDGSPNSRHYLEQQLSTALEDINLWRERVTGLEYQLSLEKKERMNCEEVIKKLNDKLNTKPNENELSMQMNLLNEMRSQIFLLASQADENRKDQIKSNEEIKNLRVQLQYYESYHQQSLQQQQYQQQKEKEIEHERQQKEILATPRLRPQPMNSINNDMNSSDGENEEEDNGNVRPHSLLVDWTFPKSENPKLFNNNYNDHHDDLYESTQSEFDDAYSNGKVQFVNVEDNNEDLGLPPIENNTNNINDNQFSNYIRSRSNSLFDQVRHSFSPSPKIKTFENNIKENLSVNVKKDNKYVDKQIQLDKLLNWYNNNNQCNNNIDFSYCYYSAGHKLSDV